MANYHEHKCLTCGQVFEYCGRCVITPVIYKAGGFCSQNCSDIYAILAKHGCNLLTADETLAELAEYNLDKSKLTRGIVNHIDELKSTVAATSEVVTEYVEPTTTVKQSKKNNKKEVANDAAQE